MKRFEELKNVFGCKEGGMCRKLSFVLVFLLLMVWPAYDATAHFPNNSGCVRLIRLGLTFPAGSTCGVHWHDLNDAEYRLVDVDTEKVVDLDTVTAPSGRVEIFDKNKDLIGKWKGICDDGLVTLGKDSTIRVVGRQEAEVVCRKLGFSGGEPLTGLNVASDDRDHPSDFYLVDELECAGSEDRPLGTDKCRHALLGSHDCGEKEAFGVKCSAATANSDAVGRVEIDGTLKVKEELTAHHHNITDADGKPFELTNDDGTPADGNSFTYQWIRVDIDSWIETEISGASKRTYTLQDADEEEYVKVRVGFVDDAGNSEEVESFHAGPIVPPDPADGELRLSGVLLEIYDNNEGQWKVICDDNWDDNDARVACQQLNLTGGEAKAVIDLNTSRRYLLDEVNCVGTEYHIFSCGHRGRGVHNCAYGEAAGVRCQQ